MSRVLYTSDLHLGHKFVSGLRGFDEPTGHDQAVVANWRNVVTPRDQVWVLGDLCLGNLDAALAIIDSLPGEKHFVAGNHDGVHPMHRNAHRLQPRYLEVFASVQPFARHKIAGRDVLLSHFPYSRDRHEARYMQWRLRDEGEWLLHGHTHESGRQVGREIHVGVDAWDLTPVPQGVITEMIEATEAGTSAPAGH